MNKISKEVLLYLRFSKKKKNINKEKGLNSCRPGEMDSSKVSKLTKIREDGPPRPQIKEVTYG